MGKEHYETFYHGSEKTEEDLKKFFLENLKSGDVYKVFDIISKFSEEFIQSESVQEIAKVRFIDLLKEGQPAHLGILEKFSLPKDFIDSEEVQHIGQDNYIYYLENGLTYEAKDVKDNLNLSNEFVLSSRSQLAALEGLLKTLGKDSEHGAACYIYSSLPLPDNVMSLQEVREAVDSAIERFTNKGKNDIAENIRKTFYPSK